jgi:outer membrane lipoprotein SlyB
LVTFIALATAGCESQSFRVDQRTAVHLGTVTNVEQVSLQSNVPAGAIVGGMVGLMAGGSNAPVRNNVLGATVGGAATAAAQGDLTGFSYTVQMVDGSTVRIISDQREIRSGDCVAIERVGETSNIRRENPAYCAIGNAAAVGAVQGDSVNAAERCEAAKAELVHASTTDAVDLATRKINCCVTGKTRTLTSSPGRRLRTSESPCSQSRCQGRWISE